MSRSGNPDILGEIISDGMLRLPSSVLILATNMRDIRYFEFSYGPVLLISSFSQRVSVRLFSKDGLESFLPYDQ